MKVTKGHFNRKVLFFGLLLFLAISLISTGFAAWIMSTGTEAGSGGNVHVGTVTDGSLEFGDIKFAGDKDEIIFDALEEDKSGDIKADLSQNAKYENLSITLTTTLTPVEYVQSLSISVAIPATVKTAADNGYITMPSCCYVAGTEAVSVVIFENGAVKDLDKTGIAATVTDTNSDGTYEISITLTFGWGRQFGGDNPGVYLDKETDGVKFTYDEKVERMVQFKKTIFGLTVVEEGKSTSETEKTVDQVLAYTKPLEFYILLSAVAN